MSSILFLGFLIGMRHALEADHVAAVASLVTQNSSLANSVKTGVVWGLGHTITLFIFGYIVILTDSLLSERLAAYLEFAVGLMLAVLGIDVLKRLSREKIHFHRHKHRDGREHFHAHAHKGEKEHRPEDHEHTHKFPSRALFVGLMHGMAGSAALILLTLETVKSPLVGLLYMGLFSLGSIIGMAALSATLSIPLRYSFKGLTRAYNSLHLVVGVTTIIIGLSLAYENRIILV